MFSVIVPTYNEAQNIPALLAEIEVQMDAAHIDPFEVLVADDDSPDRTAAAVEAMRNSRYRAINRRGRPRGLSRSALDGFAEARYPVLALMDADFSHPPSVLPQLFAAVQEGALLAVGSRYVKGGGVENWPLKRRVASRAACFLAAPVTRIHDATSGFFAFHRSIIEGVDLNPVGFKIGLEIFVRGRHEGRIAEVPYCFRDRRAGASKLNGAIMGAYLSQLGALLVRRR